MKKKSLMLVCLLFMTGMFLSGCSNALNATACMENVRLEFKENVQISVVPNHMFIFLVKNSSNEIYYVECMNKMDAKVSAKTKLF